MWRWFNDFADKLTGLPSMGDKIPEILRSVRRPAGRGPRDGGTVWEGGVAAREAVRMKCEECTAERARRPGQDDQTRCWTLAGANGRAW